MSSGHLARLVDLPVDAPRGARFTMFGILRGVREAQTRDGRPYIDAELGDSTASWRLRIWEDASEALSTARSLPAGAQVKVQGTVDTYRQVTQIVVARLRPVVDADPVDLDTLLGAGHELVSDLHCETLVFDIETIPATDLRRVPPTIAQAVTKHADRSESEEAKVMGLSPWFGQVISLALGDGEVPDGDMQTHALVVPPPDADVDAFPAWMRPMSERELLESFWYLASQATRVVTYNGRGFDVPFLVARSLVHGIPVRVDLLGRKAQRHLDLLPVVGRAGAFRASGPASLDVVCWALGIESPKGDMDGSMVAPTYARGDIERIADYNVGDVEATARIYRRAQELLLPYQSS